MNRPSALAVVFVSLLAAPVAGACPWCREEVQAAVYSPGFLSTTLLLFLPLLVIALLGVGLYYVDRRRPSETDP